MPPLGVETWERAEDSDEICVAAGRCRRTTSHSYQHESVAESDRNFSPDYPQRVMADCGVQVIAKNRNLPK